MREITILLLLFVALGTACGQHTSQSTAAPPTTVAGVMQRAVDQRLPLAADVHEDSPDIALGEWFGNSLSARQALCVRLV